MRTKDFSLGNLKLTLIKGNNSEVVVEYFDRNNDLSIKSVVDREEFAEFWSRVAEFVRSWDERDQEEMVRALYGKDLIKRLKAMGIKDMGYLISKRRYD